MEYPKFAVGISILISGVGCYITISNIDVSIGRLRTAIRVAVVKNSRSAVGMLMLPVTVIFPATDMCVSGFGGPIVISCCRSLS